MRIMIVNSKVKHKSKTMFGVIRNLVFDFIVLVLKSFWFYSSSFFVTTSMGKYPIHVTSAKSTTQNTLYITWGSKQKIFYDKQFTTVTTQKKCSKLLQRKMYI